MKTNNNTLRIETSTGWEFRLSLTPNAFEEYQVKCWKGGKRYQAADYFTDEIDDAKETFHAMALTADTFPDTVRF